MKKFKGGKAKAKAKMHGKMDEKETHQEAKYREDIMEDESAADCKWQPMGAWKESHSKVSPPFPQHNVGPLQRGLFVLYIVYQGPQHCMELQEGRSIPLTARTDSVITPHRRRSQRAR
jgi:hypothetical protein